MPRPDVLLATKPPGAPLAGVASGPDVLLATKLYLPRPQPGLVPRPRLVQALSDGLARGWVCLCAPAGFGKTALLAAWVQDSEYAVAWLCLDAGDSDPARFWRRDGSCPAGDSGACGPAARPAASPLVLRGWSRP